MRKGELTRKRIIQEIAITFNIKGFAGSTTAELMEVANIRKGSLYRYFKNKEEMALEAFDYAWSVAKEARFMNVDLKTSPREQLLKLIHYFEHPAKPVVPGGCPLFNTAVEADDNNPRLREKAEQALQEWIEFLAGIFEAGIKAGEFSQALNTQDAAYCMIATLEGALIMSRLFDTPQPLSAATGHLQSWLAHHSIG